MLWPSPPRSPDGRFRSTPLRCEHSGIGYSNADPEEARVAITATPEANVPAEVRPGLEDASMSAVNISPGDERSGSSARSTQGRGNLDGVPSDWNCPIALAIKSGVLELPSPDGGGVAEFYSGVCLPRIPISVPTRIAAASIRISADLGERLRHQLRGGLNLIWLDLILLVQADLPAAGTGCETKWLERFRQVPPARRWLLGHSVGLRRSGPSDLVPHVGVRLTGARCAASDTPMLPCQLGPRRRHPGCGRVPGPATIRKPAGRSSGMARHVASTPARLDQRVLEEARVVRRVPRNAAA